MVRTSRPVWLLDILIPLASQYRLRNTDLKMPGNLVLLPSGVSASNGLRNNDGAKGERPQSQIPMQDLRR
jgi:hypothetical protein